MITVFLFGIFASVLFLGAVPMVFFAVALESHESSAVRRPSVPPAETERRAFVAERVVLG